MRGVSLNKNPFADLSGFAKEMGDPLLKTRADELRALTQQGDDPAPTPEQILVSNIQREWQKIYGDDIGRWPERLKDSLATIRAGVGFANFDSNIITAFQNLRVEEMTVPAFESGIAVIQGFFPSPLEGEGCLPADGVVAGGEGDDFIPESAARAGLQFISNPLNLVLPIWAGGALGKLVGGTTRLLATAGGLATGSGAAIATVTGLVGEAAGFVVTNRVVAKLYLERASASREVALPEDGRASSATTVEEIGASAIFFGGLKMFGTFGRFTASFLGGSEAAIGMAKIIGHATSIVGLASTEELHEMAGIGIVEDDRTFYAKLWRAVFLHTTIHAVNGVITFERPHGRPRDITITLTPPSPIKGERDKGERLVDSRFLNIGLLQNASEPLNIRNVPDFLAAVTREHANATSRYSKDPTANTINGLLLKYFLLTRQAGLDTSSRATFAGLFALLEFGQGAHKNGIMQVKALALVIRDKLRQMNKGERLMALQQLLADRPNEFEPDLFASMINKAKTPSGVLNSHIVRTVIEGLIERRVATDELGIAPQHLTEAGARFDIGDLARYAPTNGTAVIIGPGAELKEQLDILTARVNRISVIERSPNRCEDLKDAIEGTPFAGMIEFITGDALEDATWAGIKADLIVSHFGPAKFGAAFEHLNNGGRLVTTVPGWYGQDSVLRDIGVKGERQHALEEFYYGIPLVNTPSAITNPACVTSIVVRRVGEGVEPHEPIPRPSNRTTQKIFPFGGGLSAFFRGLAQDFARAWAPLFGNFILPPKGEDFDIGARIDAAMDDFQQLGEAAKRSRVAAVMLRDFFVQRSNITTLRLLIRAAEVNFDAAEVLLGLAVNNRVVMEKVKNEIDCKTLGIAARTEDRLVTALETLHKMGTVNAWKGLAIAATQNMSAVYVLGQIASPNSGEAHAVLSSMGPKVVFDRAMKLDRWGMNAAWTLITHKNSGLIGMLRAVDVNTAIQNAHRSVAEAALLFLLRGAGHPQAMEAARRMKLDGLATTAVRGNVEAVFIMDDYRSIGNVDVREKMASLDVTALISPPEGGTPSLHNIGALGVLARNGNKAAKKALVDIDIKPFLLNRAPILKIPLIWLADAGNISAIEEVAKMIEENVIIKGERFRFATRGFRPIFEDIDIARIVRDIHLDALKAYSLANVRGVRLLARLSKLGTKGASEILFNLAMGEHATRAKYGDMDALDALAIGTRAGNWRALNGIIAVIKEGSTDFIKGKALQTLGSLVLEGVKIAVSIYNAQFPGRPLKRR